MPNDPAAYIDKSVDDNEKLRILNEKWVPPVKFNFPVTGGRKYNPQWENEHPWLRYSISKEAAYFIYWILFGAKSNSSIFQHSGSTDWKNAKGTKRGALTWHEASESHKTAVMKALSFKEICEGKLQGIHSHVYQRKMMSKSSEIGLFCYQL